jgi:hypothetical protein
LLVRAAAKGALANSQGYAAAGAPVILSGIAAMARPILSCPMGNEGMSERLTDNSRGVAVCRLICRNDTMSR